MRQSLLVACVVVLVAGVMVSLAAGGSGAAPKGRWVVTDLGRLRGMGLSGAVAVNARGQVIGYRSTATPPVAPTNDAGWEALVDAKKRAFLWDRGVLRDLGTLGGARSEPLAINDRGWVVGDSATTGGYRRSHAFLWRAGKMVDLGTLGGRESGASDINNDGQVVGWATTRSGASHAFLWEGGRMRDLGTLGGPESVAVAINERGQIVGYAETKTKDGEGLQVRHAFLWEKGRMRDLGTLGGPNSAAVGINDHGRVAGDSDLKRMDDEGLAHLQHAFMWASGRLRDTGPLTAGSSRAVAINNQGDLVREDEMGMTATGERTRAALVRNGRARRLGALGGYNSDAAAISDKPQVVGASDGHAFVWERGRLTDLHPTPAIWAKSAATAINNHDQIVGWADIKTGQAHAVLWTWQPTE